MTTLAVCAELVAAMPPIDCDPDFAQLLASDTPAAIAQLKLPEGMVGAEGEHIVAVVNEPGVHNLVICTLDKKHKFDAELEVRVGRGFATGEENKRTDQPIGLIPIDSIFSPVTRVKYAVENTRVGQRTDYDKLILEVWTDGRLMPDDALLQASAILRHHLDVFVNFNEEVIEFDETPAGVSEENMKLKKLLNMSVNEIELSVRAANCLNNANITTVGQLAQKTEGEMLKYRNFGKKSLNEIKDKLQQLGLSLGMKFEPGLVETPVAGVDGASGNGAEAVERK